MSDDPRIGEVRAEAVGTLSCWLDGYTSPDEGGTQLRFLPISEGDSHLDVRVEECTPFPTNPREYRITLTVEEL